MAVDAVASVVIQKLRDLILEESFTRHKIIESQLKAMQEGLEKMRGFFIVAAEKETKVEAIKKWTDDYLENLYYVENTIESFSLRITRQRKRLGFLMNNALFLKNFTACKKLSRKLEKIQKTIQKRNIPAGVKDANRRSKRSQQSDYAVSFNRRVEYETIEEKEEVGKEEEEEEEKNERGEREINLFVDHKTDDLISNMIHSISCGYTISNTEGNERSLLSSCSMKMRFRSGDSITRERYQQGAQLDDLNSTPHHLKKLGNEETWNLFLNKVGLEEGQEDSNLKQKIIDICNGLPLNIVLLGSLLSTKQGQGCREWNSILENLENGQISDILWLSYNDLDAHLKLCLLYLMLFPKEFDIPVRRLQRLWLAEGFVKRPQSLDGFQEDVVQDYFDNLVKRSLILVSKLRSDGSPRKCRLLGVLHDFLLDSARDISLFHVHHNSACQEEVEGRFGKRRVIEYADVKNCSFSSAQYQHLRSYISFNVQKKDTPAKYVGNFLSNVIGKGFGLLRVLDLEGVYKPSLPDNLGDLFNLRYLGLRWTFLDKLPKSVGCLHFLETLDLKHTFINRIPPSIWKLKHLRHLNLNEVRLDKDMPLHSRRSFPQLLTLWGLSVDRESPIKNGLSKLTQLRELGISFCLRQCDDNSKDDQSKDMMNGLSTATRFTEDLVDWITKLTSLQSLRLRSKDDMGCPSQLNLKPFSGLNKLSNMNLLGKLQKLPDLDHFPPNVRVLTLSVSRLDKDPMPILGQLPSLTVLRLLANSYLDEKISCPSGTFQELQVLKFWMLKNLKKWELEEGAMLKLKELNIRCCSKLENIPSRLLQNRTFKDLILTNMPEEFIKKAEMQKCRKVSITVKNYEFTPLPWEQEGDSTHGVASNIHGYSN